MKCPHCGKDITVNKPTENINHLDKGVTYIDIAVRINDAFYEIIKGPRQGNLVHIWSIIK
jgi:transcription initiation factor IIE alpha subunit